MTVVPHASRRWPFILGAVIQGLVLGALLSVVVVELWTTAADVQLFEYQKF